MPKKILNVNFELPSDDVKKVSTNSKISLLDWDIIIFNPEVKDFFELSYDKYQGKRSYSDSTSFEIQEKIVHWRREISEAFNSGKTIFITLSDLNEFYVATGKQQYSGTGRNRQTTRIVTLKSNYDFIPLNLNIQSTNGKSMKIVSNASFATSYWNSFKDISEYRVIINSEEFKPIIHTKSGNKIVSCYLQHKESNGIICLLPFIDFDYDNFTFEKDDEVYWTDEALKLSKEFISEIVKLSKSLKNESEATPAPEWLKHSQFELKKELAINAKLLKLETKLQEVEEIVSKEKINLENERKIKDLLFEKGKPLEEAIFKALEILGFSVSHFENSESEFDVVFESSEGRLIGEAEGKDNNAININKLRQLEMNINEDFSRPEVTEIAKAVLIGNAYRLIDPKDRPDFFTSKCLTASKRSNTALLSSVDLFYAAQALLNSQSKTLSKKYRKAIFNSIGIVKFPFEEGSEK